MSFGVLFVCTGNICRSPIAERLLLTRLTDPSITVRSAGTRAVVGYGMDRSAAYVLRQLGGDPEGHVARQLTPKMVEESGLVLTATTTHRDAVIRTSPGAMRRTFTMREFVRLGAGLPPMDALDLPKRVLEVAGGRGLHPAARPGADDIADPYGAPLPVMERCGQEVDAAVDEIARILGGGSPLNAE